MGDNHSPFFYITYLVIIFANFQEVLHSDTYLLLSFEINIESNILKFKSSKFSRKILYNFDTDTHFISPNKKKPYKSRLCNKKNKHRFYDTVSYHKSGAYLVRVTGLEPALG